MSQNQQAIPSVMNPKPLRSSTHDDGIQISQKLKTAVLAQLRERIVSIKTAYVYAKQKVDSNDNNKTDKSHALDVLAKRVNSLIQADNTEVKSKPFIETLKTCVDQLVQIDDLGLNFQGSTYRESIRNSCERNSESSDTSHEATDSESDGHENLAQEVLQYSLQPVYESLNHQQKLFEQHLDNIGKCHRPATFLAVKQKLKRSITHMERLAKDFGIATDIKQRRIDVNQCLTQIQHARLEELKTHLHGTLPVNDKEKKNIDDLGPMKEKIFDSDTLDQAVKAMIKHVTQTINSIRENHSSRTGIQTITRIEDIVEESEKEVANLMKNLQTAIVLRDKLLIFSGQTQLDDYQRDCNLICNHRNSIQESRVSPQFKDLVQAKKQFEESLKKKKETLLLHQNILADNFSQSQETLLASLTKISRALGNLDKDNNVSGDYTTRYACLFTSSNYPKQAIKSLKTAVREAIEATEQAITKDDLHIVVSTLSSVAHEPDVESALKTTTLEWIYSCMVTLFSCFCTTTPSEKVQAEQQREAIASLTV